jgi:hypothetical protein
MQVGCFLFALNAWQPPRGWKKLNPRMTAEEATQEMLSMRELYRQKSGELYSFWAAILINNLKLSD